uniref:Uncharacterized protein n=1 Tax=Anser cygnoides TaxID=8845 RepID=A0A8B9EPR1_ANSCY
MGGEVGTGIEPSPGVPLASPQLTVYLGKRDFVDHIDVVDPVGEWGRVSPLRDADLRLPLRPRGPGRAGADVPQGPVRGQRAGLPPGP